MLSEKPIELISVLGAGSWGTALALLLGRKGYTVRLWSNEPHVVEGIRSSGENKDYLPGHLFPHNVSVSLSLEETLEGTECIVFALPSGAVREVARQVVALDVQNSPLAVNAGKGLDSSGSLRLSEVLFQELTPNLSDNLVIMSGPNLAVEVAREAPGATVVASASSAAAAAAQRLFTTPRFRVYTNTDVIGVELSGSLKNVIAIGAGISDGFGYGDNTKAALITRGLAEITRLGTVLGADPRTFIGLAGVGDLIATCGSVLSRNLRFGRALGQGSSVAQAEADIKQVVEGKPTCLAAKNLADSLNVSMPITEQIYQVIYNGKSALDAVNDLMQRGPKDEYQ